MPDEKIAALLPGRGLDLTYASDSALEGSPLRGCQNIRIVDSEWWSREGEQMVMPSLGGQPFVHLASITTAYLTARRHFFISRWGVVELTSIGSNWTPSLPYDAYTTSNIALTPGSPIGIAATPAAIVAPSFILAEDYNARTGLYLIKEKQAIDRLILDRPFAGSAPTNLSYDVYLGFRLPPTTLSHGAKHSVNWTLFRQRVSYAAGALYSTGAGTAPYYLEESPAITAGALYLILSMGGFVISGAGVPGPVAIRLDATDPPILEFMYRTFLSTISPFPTSSLTTFIKTFKSRLMVARPDENAMNGERCLWFSDDSDMMKWHVGTRATNAEPARYVFGDGYDPMTGLELLGDTCVAHREESQEVLRVTDIATAPFTTTRNDQGFGFIASKSIVSVRGRQYGWTALGPAAFDGQAMELLPAGVRAVATLFGGTTEWGGSIMRTPFSGVDGVYIPGRDVILWHLYWRRVTTAIPMGDQNTGDDPTDAYLTYHLATGNVGLVTHDRGFSIGVLRVDDGQSGFFNQDLVLRSRVDGAVFLVTQTNQAKDGSDDYSSFLGVTPTVPATYVLTKFYDFETPRQKEIRRLELELRAFYVASAAYSYDRVADLSFLAGTNWELAVTVYSDEDLTAVRWQGMADLSGDLLAQNATLTEGGRMIPRFRVVVPVPNFTFKSIAVKIDNFTGIANAARIPFRLSQVFVVYTEGESYQREREGVA